MLITSDKLHEECGVAAIYGHPEASKLAYLSLYALQHRGQESAGIASSNGDRIELHKAMGLVSDIFHSRNAGARSRLACHRTHAIFDHRRLGAVKRAADPGGMQQGKDRAGP